MKRKRILTVFKMEMKKLIRTPMYLFFSLFFVALLVIILGLALSNVYGWGPDAYGTPRSIFEHMVPGLFAYSGIMTIFTFASAVTGDRDNGVQRRMKTTPITSGEVIVGQMLSYTILPLIQTAIILVTALLIGFNPKLTVEGVVMVFLFMIFMSFCSVGLGLITATIAKDARAAGSLAFIFIVPQQLFGSFIYMGEATRVIGYAMPSQYVTEGIYRIFFGGVLTDVFIWLDLLVIVIISFIIYVIGLKLFDR
ncbi:MAG: ABC transporter permease [Candidatus Lokiarchaeota archaeon]|nr:ABC transporter permease [Candidatus Lokiarchaeota archaeon]